MAGHAAALSQVHHERRYRDVFSRFNCLLDGRFWFRRPRRWESAYKHAPHLLVRPACVYACRRTRMRLAFILFIRRAKNIPTNPKVCGSWMIGFPRLAQRFGVAALISPSLDFWSRSTARSPIVTIPIRIPFSTTGTSPWGSVMICATL